MPGISILQDPSWIDDLQQTITLRNGRSLGYAEFGSFREDATPVFFLHGRPGSRLHAVWFHEAACDMNIRIIAIDRPGFGVSTPQRDRKVLDWPSDLSETAKLLDIEQYYIIGYSAGGPYALACAYALPKTELLGVGLLSSQGPYEPATAGMSLYGRMYYNISYYAPWLARGLYNYAWADFVEAKNDEKMIESFMKNIPPSDRDFFHKNPEKQVFFPKSVSETFRQGLNSLVEERNLLSLDWGFQLEDIQKQNVRLWHGTRDVNVPIKMSRYFDEHLPHSEMREFEGESHYTINCHAEEILKDLVDTSIV